jgi:Sugar kinases, ribokinase family
MNTQHDVIVFGGACCDLIFHGLPSMPKLGEEIWAEGLELSAGGMMNTAAALARLGLKVGLVAEAGTDVWGGFIAETMREEGIDPSFLHIHEGPYPQLTVAINYKNDRSFVSYAAKHGMAAHQAHMLRCVRDSDAKMYHFSASREYADAIKEAKRLQKTISLDASWDEEWLRHPEFKSLVGLADIFLPNQKEAEVITGKADPYEALEALAQWVPVAVVKLGEQGAICKADGVVYSMAAQAVEAVDATGAGDCFAAGFLYGRIAGMSIEECLKIAVYCGSRCVAAVGGFAGAPTLAQIARELPFVRIQS